MTCGAGNIGQSSIGTLTKELRRRLMKGDADWKIDKANFTLEQIGIKARKPLFDEHFSKLAPTPSAPHSFQFCIGGYFSDPESELEIWKITIENGAGLGRPN